VSPEQAMRQALSAGVKFFQYRNKHGARKSIYETASTLARISLEAKALFIVNDHADIAAAVDADGAHLGQDDLPIEFARKLLGNDKIIGISTHSLGQAKAAEIAGADYIGFGPIFPTTTKDAGQTRGLQRLSDIRKSISLPVVAIGGIKLSNVQDVFKSGADSAAMISAILSDQKNIEAAAENMLRLISEVRRM
jgi:thiamine-phosphate pyrophosphorylase